MRVKKTTIIDELYRIQKENNITILYASEVGSRAYGFALPDSDYDVKFIFIRPEKEYLRIKRDLPEVIDISVTIDSVCIDFNGWEITKFLTLLYDGNYSVFEKLNSPYIYIDNDQFRKEIADAKKYFIPYRAIVSYTGRAHAMRKEMKFEKIIPIKKYLHAIDAILNARQVYASRMAPSLIMTTKLYLLNNDTVLKKVLELIDSRNKGIVNTVCIPELDEYIINSGINLDSIARKWEGKKDSTQKYSDMDDILYRLIKMEGK